MKANRGLASVVLAYLVFSVGMAAQQPAADETAVANSPQAASASVPRLIRYSGTLTDLSGKPLTGTIEVQFAIYQDQNDASPLWQEIQSLQLDAQGHYAVLLGVTQPEGLPAELFSSGMGRWLGVEAAGAAPQPHVLLVAVPYALKAADADTLGGKPASAFMVAQPAGEASSSQNPGTVAGAASSPTAQVAGKKDVTLPIPVSGNGTPGYLPLWTVGNRLGNSLLFQSGNNVGVGTTAPGAALDAIGSGISLRGTSSGAGGTGVFGSASGTTGNNTGVYGQTATTTNYNAGVSGLASATSGIVFGVNGGTNSTTQFAAGVNGYASATTGQVYGVSGGTSSTTDGAAGVTAWENATTGRVFGVSGGTNSTTNGAAGVNGSGGAATGAVFGVNGSANSTTNNAAGVNGYETATTGIVFGVNGGTWSTTTNAAGVDGYAIATTGQVYGVAGGTSSTTNGAAGVQGGEGATTGQVWGVSGATFSTTNGAAGVQGGEGATTGQVWGVSGVAWSTTQGAAGAQGGEGAATGQVYGVWGSTNSTGPNAAGVNGWEGATTGQVYGVNGGTNSTTQGAAAVNGYEGATTGIVFGLEGGTSSTTLGAAGVNGWEGATTGQVYGVSGGTSSGTAGAAGVFGNANAITTTGWTFGVYGQCASTSGCNGVGGNASATSGNGTGVWGSSASSSGNGVMGYASSSTGVTFGVQGMSLSPSGVGVQGSSPNVAVAGFNQTCGSTGCTLVKGVAGQFVTGAGGTVLQGIGPSSTVFTVDASGNGYYAGNLNVTGSLSKGSGSFKIDHPLDPANKYLSHSFVESPDMKNVYDGVIRLDAKGEAWVSLPDYFEALNRDFRYQLTSIGAPAPNLYVAEEVSGNRFKIAGGKPGGKVSWQVTGIRQDAYANANRIPVEEVKPPAEQGYYLHPELYGQPGSRRVGSAEHATHAQQSASPESMTAETHTAASPTR